jgi:hypothetical protein
MAKKVQRKRSGPARIVIAKPPKVEEVVSQRTTIYQDFPIRPLNNNDSAMVKDMFSLSNNFAALMKKFADTELQVRASNKFVGELKAKKIKGPLMIRASPNVFIPMHDMTKASENINKEVALIEKENTLTRGQIEHRYEEYIDSLIRFKRILTALIGDKELTTLSGYRANDAKSLEESQIIFQKEFEKMSDEELKKLPNEVKDVIAKDKAKKKTCTCKDGACECESCKQNKKA